MNALGLQAEIARRHGCTFRLTPGLEERDSLGRAAGPGEACIDCGLCARDQGDVGAMRAGIRLVGRWDGLRLSWVCPGCGGETVETTDALACFEQARTIEQDPRCCLCRGRS